MTTNSSAAGNLYQARMGPNSNTKTPETHNLDAQTTSNGFEKKGRCYTVVNMPPFQLFWDLWQASYLKWAHFAQTIKKFLSLNIYVIYVLLLTKYWLMWFEIRLVLILLQFKKRQNNLKSNVLSTELKTSSNLPLKEYMCLSYSWSVFPFVAIWDSPICLTRNTSRSLSHWPPQAKN